MIRDGDDVAVVLHHQHRVPLVPQLPQQPEQAVHVARVQPDARLVEHVRQPRETGAEVPDRLQPLPLPARQRRRLPVQAEIPEPDRLDPPQPRDGVPRDGPSDRVAHLAQHPDQVADLHGRQLRQRTALYAAGPRRLVQPGTAARRTGAARDDLLDRPPRALRQRGRVPLQVEPGEAPHEALVRVAVAHADAAGARDLEPAAVQEQVPLLGREVPERLVRVEETRSGEHLPLPAAHPEPGEPQGPLVQRPVAVDHGRQIHLPHPPEPVALRAHAARVVERVGRRLARAGRAAPGEQHPQRRADVGHRSHGGPRVPPDRPLVHDHGGRQPGHGVRERPFVPWQSVAHKPGERFVQLPL